MTYIEAMDAAANHDDDSGHITVHLLDDPANQLEGWTCLNCDEIWLLDKALDYEEWG